MNKKILALLLILAAGCTTSPPQPATYYAPQQNTTQIMAENQTMNTTTNQTELAPTEHAPFLQQHPGNLTAYILKGVIFITTPRGETLMLDAGTFTDFEANLRQIKNVGHAKLTHLIVTNTVQSKLEAVPYALERLKPEHAFYSGYTNENDYELRLMKSFMLGFVKIPYDTILAEDNVAFQFHVPYDDGKGFAPTPSKNSVTVRIVYGSFILLIGSDCTGDCEERTLSQSDLSSTAAVLPSMGSCHEDSTSTYYLKQVNASILFGRNICSEVKAKTESLSQKTLDIESDFAAITSDGSGYAYYLVK